MSSDPPTKRWRIVYNEEAGIWQEIIRVDLSDEHGIQVFARKCWRQRGGKESVEKCFVQTDKSA